MKHYDESRNYIVSGRTFNEISKAVNAVNGTGGHSGGAGAGLRPCGMGEVRIIFTGNGTAPKAFEAVNLSGTAVVPEGGEFTVRDVPVFSATVPAADGYPFAVTIEPAQKGRITRAAVLGVVPLKVKINDSEHKFVKISEDGGFETDEVGNMQILSKIGEEADKQWCLVNIGCGSGGDKIVQKLYWAVQVTDGSPVDGIECELYDSPGGELVAEGKVFGEPVNASCEVSNLRFWAGECQVKVLTYEEQKKGE